MALILGASTLFTAAAAATIAAAIGGLLALVYRAVRRLEGVVGTDKNGRTLNERMDRVEHQLWPNGGTSLADAVHRTASDLIGLRAESRLTRDLVTKVLSVQSDSST